MALENKGFRHSMESGGKRPSIPKKSFRFNVGADDLRRKVKKGGVFSEEFSHLRRAVGDVVKGPNLLQKKVDEKRGVADLLIHGLKASKERTAKKERRIGAMDIFFGLTPQQKKSIPSKIKSALFGKEEKVIKYKEFEKFLKDPSLYKIDKLSAHERKKRWKEVFKETGTGYLQKWKVKKYFKDRALKPPPTIKGKILDKQYKEKFLGK